MKKRFIELQLFAEDGGDGGDGGQQGNQQQGEGQQSGKNGEGNISKPELKYTDEDVDKLFNKKFAEWEKKKQKEIDEAKKLAEMNAQERAEHERDELQKELDALKKKDSLSEMTKTARKMLSDEGVSVPDEVLAMIVDTDAEKTKAAVDAFGKAFKDAVESAVKEKLKGNPPKKGEGKKLTKEQIFSIKDPIERQNAIAENMDLFN